MGFPTDGDPSGSRQSTITMIEPASIMTKARFPHDLDALEEGLRAVKVITGVLRREVEERLLSVGAENDGSPIDAVKWLSAELVQHVGELEDAMYGPQPTEEGDLPDDDAGRTT